SRVASLRDLKTKAWSGAVGVHWSSSKVFGLILVSFVNILPTQTRTRIPLRMANTKLKPAETSITDGHSDACWSRLIAASPFAAHMLPPTMVGGGYQITFSVYAGGTYTPQRTESLAGPWIDLPNGDTQWKRNGTLLAQTCQQSVRSVARFLV